jgi:hypothetical protein
MDRKILNWMPVVLFSFAVFCAFSSQPGYGQGSDNCWSTPTVVPLLPDISDTGTTAGYANDYDCGRGHAGPDVVYKFIVSTQTPVPLDIQIIGTADFDADWSITSVCDATSGDIGCWDFIYGIAPPTPGNKWGLINHHVDLDHGEYYIWVDGHTETASGNYEIVIKPATPTPTFTPTPVPTS